MLGTTQVLIIAHPKSGAAFLYRSACFLFFPGLTSPKTDAPCIVNMLPREVGTSRLWVRILPAKAQRWMTLFEPEGMHSGTVVSISGEEWAFVRVKPIFDHPQTSVNSEESRLIGAHLIVSNRWSVRVWVFDGEAKAEVVLNDCGTLIFVVLLFHFACLSWSGIRSRRESFASHV